MIAKFFIITLLTTLACGVVFSQQVEIFRTVKINQGKSITLAEDFSKMSGLFESVGDMYGLKKGLYGQADRILVRISDDQKIKAIYFNYDEKKDFQAAVKSYESSLGKRTGDEARDRSDIRIRKVFWEDSKTRFELIEREQNGSVMVSSILSDK